MFKAILVVLLLAAVALASVDREHIEAFSSFKARFNKSYANKAEELARFKAFADNFDFIKRHNAEADQGLHTFWVGENEYADMTNEEFNRVMNTLNFDYNNRARQHSEGFCNTKDHSTLVGTNPTSVDWRTKGAVTPIKNQGQCGSCWSFSTTGVIEGQNFLTNGKLVSLSEQNLVDCSTNEGNMGCNGGFPEWAYEYVIGNNGIDTEASYPYQAQGPLKCRYTVANKGATTVTCNDITPHQSETALENAVATIGPISVCVDASHTSFQLYSHGIYKEPQCSTTQLDHAILAVGYDSNAAGEYWIVKNSWGTTWGLQGYIWMAKDDNNMCGIATHASYSLQTSA